MIEAYTSIQPFEDVETQASNNIPVNDDDSLVQLIKDSSLYKQAYEIFSSDTQYGTPFLRQLEMIPYDFSIRDPNFWDEVLNFFGGTSDWENLISDTFNSAMDEIRLLVQNYYTFINGLPREQVEQLAEAGINASITGEGISPSSMASDPVPGLNEPLSQSDYNNKALSSGISSFVEFINSMANLGLSSASSESIMGMLDLAEREGYNKQELHDLMMSQFGISSDSPYRVLDSESNEVISLNTSKAVSDAKVSSALSQAESDLLDTEIDVPVGNDPNNIAHFEKMSGRKVLNQISRFKMVNDFSNMYTANLTGMVRQLYAESLAYLEGEYNAANYGALIAESGFNQDFFSARSGKTEGSAQTSIVSNLSFIRQCERKIKEFEAWMADYKLNTLDLWSQEINKSPSLAPFFYKAMFDFDMTDTFYHMSPWSMGLKYGMENIDRLSNVIGNIMGVARPKKPRVTKTSSTSSGPRGITESYTETITE